MSLASFAIPRWFWGMIVLLLGGCSSNSGTQLNHYFLQPPGQAAPALPATEVRGPIVVLQKLRLANYLQQPSLVLQLKQHELYYSMQDLWAEPLQQGFSKALLMELNQGTGTRRYVSYQSPGNDDHSLSLAVQLDHFLATDESQVVASGEFWLLQGAQDSVLYQQRFHYRLGLRQDGYHHAVSQLRQLVSQLAADIDAAAVKVKSTSSNTEG